MFRNLRDPLRELIVRLKIMKKSHVNILITFTKDARNDHFAVEDKPVRVLSLISLSFLVFLEFVGSLALF